MARFVLWFVLALGGCVSSQRLSASIFAHEQLARDLDASGEHAAATTQRSYAERDRERLGGLAPMLSSRDGW